MKNLVIGSEGFVGKSLCHYLESLNEEVIHFDIKRNINEDAREFQFDFKNFDRIYFLAWEVGGAKYLYRNDTQLQQIDWNIRLLMNIMDQLNGESIPFIFISSQLAEHCDTVYGVTKRLGEIWTSLLNGVKVRLWNVYGIPEPINERSHVISDFVYQALTKHKISMLTTGEEYRQFIHISDACNAFHMAISNRLTSIYDVTSFEWVKIIDIANIIAKYTGAEIEIGEKQGNTQFTPIKGKIPNWNPTISIDEGLYNLINDYRNIII